MGKVLTWVLSAFVSCLGCGRKDAPAAPQPPAKASIADLTFPVVWVFGDTSVMPVEDAAGLGSLHSNYLNINPERPKHLIDSSLRIFKAENLRSTRSGLGQTLNPSGSTPVAFELVAGEQGIEPVRRMIAAVRYLGSEPD